MIARHFLAHLMVLLLALPPQAVMADMLTQNTLGSMGGGATAGAPADTSAAGANMVNAAAAAAQARAAAQDMLTRNTLALEAVQAMQDAARAAAATMNNAGANPNFPGTTLPNVPNGLGTGGLDLNRIVGGANTPSQSVQNARTIVEIQQTQQQAMLEWNTFNVGRQTTVKFDQSAGGADVGSWIAFNRITDPSGNPTQILGSIEAQGQVYVINQNGIIFGGASEVNTHTLVASSLPINDNLITRGLLNNPDSQFLFTASAQPAGTKGPTPAYTPPSPPAFGRIGAVTVQAGARITAPTTSANVGGRVALIGPNVTNQGTISTPDGQTILAAGMQVGFDAHSSNDPSLRGLDVYVGNVGSYGGTATNSGLISAPRGNVTVTGKNVNQNGFIDSSTSVALNGRVDLLANYNAVPNANYGQDGQGGPFVYASGTSTGIVRVGAGSVTRILPQWGSTETVVGTELALKSQINMQGLGIYLGAGAMVHAPNANVTLSAGVWDLLMPVGTTDLSFVNASGQVYLDQNAVIDVSGSTGVASSITQYLLTVDLRGAELADVPLQKNGVLRGQSVTVDLRQTGKRSDGSTWYGTAMANLAGYVGVIQRNVGELTTAGGTVNVKAGESVVMQQGSGIRVAGGYQEYAAGAVQTTRLYKGNAIVDIADADPSVAYDGIYTGTSTTTDTRWGTSVLTTGVFASNAATEAAHLFGSKGGAVAISAASMALDGSFAGGTVVGPQQLDAAPEQGSLALQWQSQQLTRSPLVFPYASPTPPRVEIGYVSSLPAAAAFGVDGTGKPMSLRQERRDAAVISPVLLTSQGFGSLTLNNSDGDIVIPAGVTLAAPAAGRISLRGGNVDVRGSLLAPAGTIDLIAYNVSPYLTALLANQGGSAVIPPVNPARGRITTGAGARLSTAGLVINDRADAPAPFSVPHMISSTSTISGGSISARAYSIEIAAGSILDVSGGMIATGGISYGNAGSLSIKAGNDPLIGSLLGGHLTLGGSLLGFSGTTGGSVALQAPIIQIGGSVSYANTLLLSPLFFSAGGFHKFTLTGLGADLTPPGGAENFAPAVLITGGAQVQPLVSRLQGGISLAGNRSAIYSSIVLEPEGYRDAAILDFEAPGVKDFKEASQLVVRGNIVMDAGTRIVTDALGEVTLHGQTVQMLGQISAPAGVVKIQGASHFPQMPTDSQTVPRFTVLLGSTSVISAAGKAVLKLDALNRRRGSVYDGGHVTVSGNVFAQTGSMLDVSGGSAVIDLLPTEAGLSLASFNAVSQLLAQSIVIPTRIDSSGGSMALAGAEVLFSDAALRGFAGGPDAAGGSLSVSSGLYVVPGSPTDDKDITLLVAQSMSAFAQPVFAPGKGIIGSTLVTAGNAPIAGLGYFGVNAFQGGGFDSLALKGNIGFRGAVDVSGRAALQIADGGVIAANALTRLSAPYVVLGLPLLKPIRDEDLINPFEKDVPGIGPSASVFSPTFGTGRLEVVADVIEAGFLSLQNIGSASLVARQELHGNGYLDIAGHLAITAGQIYPVTASTFNLTAYDYTEGAVAKSGSITIASSGITPALPLSGGGRLGIFASTITQGGALRAPLGTIRLGWDGSGTAPKGLVTETNVPVTKQLTLANGSTTSVSAVDPRTGAGVSIPYGIVKDGTNWIDPTGFDITSTGAPDKTLRVSALNVTTEAGSTLDLRGGGELFGYRWVKGNGGTTDILADDGVFAILPGYGSLFSPFAPFADVSSLGGDAGYANDTLHAGDRIYLKGGGSLATGSYTLLPARYAALPGAMLVTPGSDTPVDAFVKPGGALQTTGFVYNVLNPSVTSRRYQSFEVAAQSVVDARAEYTRYSAQDFISAAQQRLSLAVTRGPLDAGYALIGAQQSMQLAGNVSAAGAGAGRGGRVDISSPLDIVIAPPGAAAQPGKLVLNASLLSGWNAESLIIGGERTAAGGITTRTANLTLNNNAASALTGRDIILVARENLSLASGSALAQSGTQTVADAFAVAGNGVLVRVSGVSTAQTTRSGVTASALPQLNVAANATISGAGITLDSSDASAIDSAALLSGNAVNLSSGRISVQLNTPGALQPNPGLVLRGTLLNELQAARRLSLLSYSSIDWYGTGAFNAADALELHAGEMRGFNNAGGVTISASSLLLDNSASGGLAGIVAASTGDLTLVANAITIGRNALAVDQFGAVTLTASTGLTMQGAGSFLAQNALNIIAPFVRADSAASQALAAGGLLSLSRPAGAQAAPMSLGLGAQLALQGSAIVANTDVLLPSGVISLRALTGNVDVGGRLDAGGVARQFFDVRRFTDAGQVSISADAGNVNLGTSSVINLAADSGGGNAGLLVLNAAGQLSLNGSLSGQGVKTGSVELDVGTLASFADLNDRLNAGAFTESRDLRIRSGDVTINGTVNARRFLLGLDQGSITVNGTINASGSTGGRIDLIANGNVIINSGASLTVRGQNFDSAGKGGAIWLESGASRNGVAGTGRVTINAGSTLDLGVVAKTAGSAARGQFSGKVHIRAPQNGGFTDMLVDPLAGTFVEASSIEIEGYRLYSYNQSNVLLRAGTTAIAGETLTTTTINTNATNFFTNYAAMFTRLLGGNAAIQGVSVLQPGVEINNRGGSIALGTPTSAAGADWNLATFRYGPLSAPGVLTLRASGNLDFHNTLSDGFTVATSGTTPVVERMWMAPLSAQNTALPVNTQSWTYRLAAGADVSAANFREVRSLDTLGSTAGNLNLGKDAGQAVPSSAGSNTAPGDNALTRLAINPSNNTATTGNPNVSNRFQVIRTGTGDIEIAAGRDVRLLNQFATIYTAGVSVPDITNVFSAGDFVRPIVAPTVTSAPVQTGLGAFQQFYAAQYSLAGGNVTVSAQADIIHLTKDGSGNLIADSQRQLPNNWLMRRGYVNPVTGLYGQIQTIDTPTRRITDSAASTTWWVDFSNFFDGVASLGGGNVQLKAGRDVQNVSAHAATNARAATGAPSAAKLLELGGGDVSVIAGRNIDGGVYYVERGAGTLSAGGSVTTNATRSPSLGRLAGGANEVLPSQTWLPTTLFVGKSSFDVSARGDVLLGPVANPFLLPQGLNNKHWYKTYFSTLAADSAVRASSLGGNITFRQNATTGNTAESILSLWLSNELALTSSSAASYQPWLRLVESDVSVFKTLTTLMPGTLRAVAYTGDVNVSGTLNLSPSASGTIDILARGAFNGLRPTGVSSSIIAGSQTTVWAPTTMNLSDANPASIPGTLSPYAYFSVVGTSNTLARQTNSSFLLGLDSIFAESGSTTGSQASTQTKQTLHAAGPLHAADADPVRIYAGAGDVSGLTLFSGKAASVLAGQDITDISFYIQNVRSSDVSIISSGRDIIAYNANSALRTQAFATGNLPVTGEAPKAGDIQISGPGTLQILAGRDLSLGTGSNNPDGTGVGITSIGNGRNPYLPFDGADLVLAAGVGEVSRGLGGGVLDFTTFLNDFGGSSRYLGELATLLGVPSVNLNDPALTSEQQKQLALALFYIVLRDAGRDRNDPTSPDVGTYAAGYRAINALIPTSGPGGIYTQARDVRTKSGGDISILTPGGGLQLASTVLGETLAPPGIITEAGGNISVFAKDDVSIGIARIFTLRGGDIMIWSSEGDIAAGSSAKTVQSAPPTRVLIDPQSANVATDLAGLATGGGIGVLATVAGVRPGNVDLIAPLGAVDAGDAGIRATGNLNIAASVVLNAANISVGGSSGGTPSAPAVAAPSLGGISSAAAATAATNNNSAAQAAAQQAQQKPVDNRSPSIITVEVLGYGGGEGDEEEDDEKKKRRASSQDGE